MASLQETTNLIDQAIKFRKDVWIRYRDPKSAIVEEVVSPLGWIDEDKTLFTAYCLLRSEDGFFNVFTIVEARIPESPIDNIRSATAGNPEIAGQVPITPLLAKSLPRIAPEEEAGQTPPKLLEKVEMPQDWRQLFQYYLDCLHYEQLACTAISKQEIYKIALDPQQALEFLLGQLDLQFSLTFRRWQQSFLSFTDRDQHAGETLCLGSLFYSLNENTIIPLLYNVIEIESVLENQVLVKAEEHLINITPWLEAGWRREKIANLLAEADRRLRSGCSLHELAEFFQAKLRLPSNNRVSILSSSLSSLDELPPQTLFEGSGIFWLSQAEPSAGLSEMIELSNERHWNSSPDALLSILNQKQPESHSFPGSTEESFTITNLSPNQRRAAGSANKPFTLISGPPGAGKTEILINILLQAFLEGKTVLYTCQNKSLVDQIYHRLATQYQFPGVLRAGKFDRRLDMAHRIDHLITQIRQENVSEYRERYQVNRLALQEAEETLDRIQDQLGKEQAYRAELSKIEERLPEIIARKLRRLNLPYHESEKQILLEALAKLSDLVRGLINDRNELQARMQTAVVGKESPHPATTTLREYEERWGAPGGNELSFQRVTCLEDLISFLQLWANLLSALEAKHAQDLAQTKFHSVEQKTSRAIQKVTEEQKQRAYQFAEQYTRGSLVSVHKKLAEIRSKLEKQNDASESWQNRITAKLRILDPLHSAIQRFSAVLLQIGWADLSGSVLQHSQPDELLILCNGVQATIRAAILLQKTKENHDLYESAREAHAAISSQLSAQMQTDILKMDLTGFDSRSLLQELLAIQQQASDVILHRKDIGSRITELITDNKLRLQVIDLFQQGFQGPERAFFKINENTSENQMLEYLRIWRRMIWFWELNTILMSQPQQKATQPAEEDALAEVSRAQSILSESARELLFFTWQNRANSLSQAAVQGASRYSLTVQEEEQFRTDPPGARITGIKGLQRDNFPYVLRLFPIWIACEEDVAEDFPLTSELFDVLIIDQAGLTNIPTALSLMYRAKRLIFASDPAQSQVVSLLSQGTNALLLEKHGVKTDQFSYHHSLADLVRDSASNAVVALTEHYRSDPRIATFINQEFYDCPQRMQTNLTQSGYKAAFVNQVGGIYWVDVKGIFQYRSDGGAENITEREYIQELLSKFVERSKQAGQSIPSIAVISPFRAQADKIDDWVKGALPGMFEVQSGAPLDFSGIEKDIILLSPVVSSGAPKEIMESAEMSARWLNLAVSRARVAVIVVGDWNFCYHQMAADSAYHHLAKYAGEKCGSVLSSLAQLPLLGGTSSCRRGIYTNPADPSHSRTSLEQMLSSLRENITWIDPQFTPQVVELFDEVISREKALKLSQIRLITSRKQIYPEVGKPILPGGVLVNFSTFLRNMGVHFELRTASSPQEVEQSRLGDSTGLILPPAFSSANRRFKPTAEFITVHAAGKELEDLWGAAERLEANG